LREIGVFLVSGKVFLIFIGSFIGWLFELADIFKLG
jgi:hypothetical protein